MSRTAATFLACIVSGLAAADVEVVGRAAALTEPFSVVFAPDGTLYGVEYENGNRVFTIDPAGRFEVIAGAKSKAGKNLGDIAKGDGGPAKRARFNGMHELALAPDGKIYVADTFNNRVRLIADGRISTFAGIGGSGGYGGDGGPASEAAFDGVYTVALSHDATRLLLADLGNRRVREIDLATKIIRTVAGNGRKGTPKDGEPALEQPLVAPRAACYGADGSIYIASREGNALRHVQLDGTIQTVVNSSGQKGYAGDGGDGRAAKLNGPKHLSLDPDGNIVIADDVNHCIRLYKPADGTIHLLAGTPTKSGDNIGAGPLDTELNRPHGARYDPAGNLHVADSFNHRILQFTK